MFNGEKLGELIRERGMKQKDVAAKVGITEAFLSYIINGLREPSVSVASQLAKVLDTKIDDLIKIY